jgi:hypothetical protein
MVPPQSPLPIRLRRRVLSAKELWSILVFLSRSRAEFAGHHYIVQRAKEITCKTQFIIEAVVSGI